MSRERRRYADFVLQIETLAPGCYRARVIEAPVGEGQTEFSLPWMAEELLEVRELGQRAFRSSPGVLADEEIHRFGGALFRAVFSGGVEVAFRTSCSEAAARGEGLRVRLRLNRAPELSSLPWEYLYDESLGHFLSLAPGLSLVRQPEIPRVKRAFGAEPPVRVLVLVADPRDLTHLNAEEEWTQVRQALAPLEQQGRLILERLGSGTLTALRKALRQQKYHALHFLGHGAFEPGLADGYLVLEDEEGRSQKVSGQMLGVLLAGHPSLRLVVINACSGARKSGKDSFGGVAESLVRTGIPAVIAMQFPVTDRAAISFAREFYETLACGVAVDEALAEARLAMMALEGGEMEWGAPVLYLRSKSGRLFKALPDAGESARKSIGRRSPISAGVKAAAGILLLAGAGTGVYLSRDDASPAQAKTDMIKTLSPCPSPPGFPAMVFLAVPPEQRPPEAALKGALCVGKYEVTQEEWTQVMGSPPPGGQKGAGFPATGVSLIKAREYVQRLSARTNRTIRLLTAKEWKHVAGAGSETKFSFSDLAALSTFGNCQGKDGFEGLAPVGELTPNPWGFHDFHGNVWEWVEDASRGKGAAPRGLRCGGSFQIQPEHCHTKRCVPSTTPTSDQDDFGLRVAYELGS